MQRINVKNLKMTKEYPTKEGYYIISIRKSGRGYLGYLFKYYGKWRVSLDPFYGDTFFGDDIKWRSEKPIIFPSFGFEGYGNEM